MSDLFNPTAEHQALRRLVREFAEREVDPQATRHDREERFNLPLFRRLGDLGLLGITVAAEDGGAAMDATAAVIVCEELGSADPGFTLAYLAHAILFANNLAHNADPEQRRRILPAVCRGEKVGGMCLSEPAVGTDVLGMQTTARREGDQYLLHGTKMWITNGALDDDDLGDVFLVYARMRGAGRRELSQFLVEKGSPGFTLGQKLHDKLGMRASTTAELVFEDCRVPADNLIGAEGQAMLHMMRNLEIERLTLAGISLGIARRCIEVMMRYTTERHAFGQPLHAFGQIQRYIADSYAEFMAGRCYTYQIARGLDLTARGNRVDSDGVKLYTATMAKDVADRAIQVLGGYGYVGEYQVERLWRDAKLMEIGGGTIEAHQKNMSADLVAGDGTIP